MFKRYTLSLYDICTHRVRFKTIALCRIAIVSLVYTAPSYAKVNEFGPIFGKYLSDTIKDEVPGYAVGLIVGDENHIMTEGVREVGKPDAMIDENTIFRLASVSKTFASSAVITLKDSDLSFDSLMLTYLPSLEFSHSEYQKKMTLGHVLSQSSGLFPQAYTNLIEDNVPYTKVVKKLKNVEFICKPGHCYSYQNVAYSLAGDVLAKVSGSTYEKVVEENIFQALGMNDSSFGLDALLASENRASPHRWVNKHKRWRVTRPKKNYYQLSPSAGVNTSVSDMVKWLEAQLGKHPGVLSESDLSVLHTPQVNVSRKRGPYRRKSWRGVSDMGYALGWRTFSFDGEPGFVHHGGWVEGFRVEMVLNKRMGIGMFFVTNSEPSVVSEIVPTFIRMYAKHASQNVTGE